MKLTLINISSSAASPVPADAKVTTRLGLEAIEHRSLFTVSIWRYLEDIVKPHYDGQCMTGRANSAFPTGKEKRWFKGTNEEIFLKTKTRRLSALYLAFSCYGLDKPFAHAA